MNCRYLPSRVQAFDTYGINFRLTIPGGSFILRISTNLNINDERMTGENSTNCDIAADSFSYDTANFRAIISEDIRKSAN